jgi:hypothetical protein
MQPQAPQPVLPELQVSYSGMETIHIDMKAVKSGATTIDMYDMNGKKIATIFSQELEANESRNFQIPMPGQKNAMYFFTMTNVDQVVSSYSYIMR